MDMNIVCLDLEGVLVPEIWIAFAEASGIPELKRTTRDEPDYNKLMNWRLGILKDQIPTGKLSLLVTAKGQAKKGSGKFAAVDAASLEELTRQGTAYYSDRYACAYVETKDAVAWYLDGRALNARRQLLNCFGVNALCVSTLNGTLSVD